jgi:hypothetical protein
MLSSLRRQTRIGMWMAGVAVLAALAVALLATPAAAHAADDAGGVSLETTATVVAGPMWTEAEVAPAAFASFGGLSVLPTPLARWSGAWGLSAWLSPKGWCVDLGICEPEPPPTNRGSGYGSCTPDGRCISGMG